MHGLHFSIDVPVEEQSQLANGTHPPAHPIASERRIARGFVDLPGAPGRRVEVVVTCAGEGEDALEVNVRAHDEPATTTYLIPLAWLMRRVALAHLAYRPDLPRTLEPSPRAD